MIFAFFSQNQKVFTDTMNRLKELARAGKLETVSSLSQVTSSTSNHLAATNQQQLRIVMDQRTGRILGSIPSQSQPGPRPSLSSPARQTVPSTRGRGGVAVRHPLRPKSLIKPAHSLSPQPSSTNGRSPQVVDLTKGSDSGPAATIRKSFPALSVVARPQRAVSGVQAKRSELDLKVKGLLVHTPAKFTEWLIQQGLVRSEQYEGKIKLKLGMYSDGKKFPHSGGYVWIQVGVQI